MTVYARVYYPLNLVCSTNIIRVRLVLHCSSSPPLPTQLWSLLLFFVSIDPTYVVTRTWATKWRTAAKNSRKMADRPRREPQRYIIPEHDVVPKAMCNGNFQINDSASHPVRSDCTGAKREETGNRVDSDALLAPFCLHSARLCRLNAW